MLRLGLIVVAGTAGAAERSPYGGWQERTIKALAPEQIEDYLAGRGMAMALPAELNGYSGPRQVLDLAGKLALTPEQLAQTEALFEDMRQQASDLGARIMAHEAELDELFASGTADGARVGGAAKALGLLSGRFARASSELSLGHARSARAFSGRAVPAAAGIYSSTAPGEHDHGHGGR